MAARTQRILCLWFPEWALQRRLAAQPEHDRCLLLLTELKSRGAFVRHCNRLAWKRGVRPGMPVSEARTFSRPHDRLLHEAIQPAQDRQALVGLALRCERFGFRIGLEEEDAAENIYMDVTGVGSFFSGEQGLARELDQILSHRRYNVRIAISETMGSAWAAAHFLATPHQPAVIPTGNLDRLEGLPVMGLRLKETTATRLHRLGIQTIRQLRALDRTALTRRFGADLLLRLDQFAGQRPELFSSCRPQPTYRVEQRLEEGLVHPAAIEQLWLMLLNQLAGVLAMKRLGIRRLECRFVLEDQTSESISLRLCQATSNLRHIADLLRLQQERLPLASPVIGLHLEAVEVAIPESVQQELLKESISRETSVNARQYPMLLNRLSSRLGDHAVLAPTVLPDPIPERSVRLCPISEVAQPVASTARPTRFQSLDRPTSLFSRPRPIEVVAAPRDGSPIVLFYNGVRLDIARSSTPERIESGWWDEEYVCRDYYHVETEAGQWLWIFRRLQDDRWFCQGGFF